MSKVLVRRIFEQKWEYVLIVCAIVMLGVNALLFYPGYMSQDSLIQLSQARGDYRVGDWHPPIMMLVWRILLTVTSHVSSMMIFQLILFWSALCILAVFTYHQAKSKRLSFMALVIGTLPFILNISGVVWKDVQMAFSLALAVSLLLIYARANVVSRYNKWIKLLYVTMIVLLVGYAMILRYNAFPAIIPILYLTVKTMFPSWNWRRSILGIVTVVLVIISTNTLINKLIMVEKDNPMASVMLDDIINTRSAEQLQEKKGLLYEDLRTIQRCVSDEGVIMNSYWLCSSSDQRQRIHRTEYEEVLRYWIGSIIRNPYEYLTYRLQTFAMFLFAPNSYIFHEGINSNSYGLKVSSIKLQTTLKLYTQDFGYRHFPYFFQPWFWLAAGIATASFIVKKIKKYKLFSLALVSSSLLYILSYIPLAVAVEYRYVYWSAIATLIAWLIIGIELFANDRKGEVSATKP